MSDSVPSISPEPLFPPLALAAYIACVAGAGVLANCSVIAALLKSSVNGLFSIIIQIAIADFVLGSSIGSELWSYNARTWYFSNAGCVVYRGLNVLASTASAYLVATMALHTLATINLEEKSIARRIKRSEQDEEIRTSRHSLVASSDSSTPPRTMNVDYRLNDTRIPVAQPSAFVWILSISLSIPEFALATALHTEDGIVLCTVLDTGRRLHNMYTILALINLLLQIVIMTTAATLVIMKLKSKKILSLIDSCELKASLKLSLCLIMVYVMFCAPRALFSGYNIYTTSKGNETLLVEMSQHNDIVTSNVVLSGAYLASTFVRPLLCIAFVQTVRKVFSFSPVYTDANNV